MKQRILIVLASIAVIGIVVVAFRSGMENAARLRIGAGSQAQAPFSPYERCLVDGGVAALQDSQGVPDMDAVLETAAFICMSNTVKTQYGIREDNPVISHRTAILNIFHRTWYRDTP